MMINGLKAGGGWGAVQAGGMLFSAPWTGKPHWLAAALEQAADADRAGGRPAHSVLPFEFLTASTLNDSNGYIHLNEA